MRGKAKRIVNTAAFTALALVMHVLEGFLPPLLPFAPGVRLGLANIFTFLALIFCGGADALAVQVLRCLLGAVFGGNVSALMYSLTAGLLSYAVMWTLYTFCWRALSLVGISLACSAVHNAAQVCVAALVLGSFGVLYYLPYVVLVGSAAGLFTGAVTYFVVKYAGDKLSCYTERGGKRGC